MLAHSIEQGQVKLSVGFLHEGCFLGMGVAENGGLKYSTLNSRILITRTPK